jgi:hypothetical protein
MYAVNNISLTDNELNLLEMPGFGPATEILLFRQKDPKPLTPRPASSEKANAGHGRADQLAGLRQGPPAHESVRLWGRMAGVGQRRGATQTSSLWKLFRNYYNCLLTTNRDWFNSHDSHERRPRFPENVKESSGTTSGAETAQIALSRSLSNRVPEKLASSIWRGNTIPQS